jgi:hypothetical protein
MWSLHRHQVYFEPLFYDLSTSLKSPPRIGK